MWWVFWTLWGRKVGSKVSAGFKSHHGSADQPPHYGPTWLVIHTGEDEQPHSGTQLSGQIRRDTPRGTFWQISGLLIVLRDATKVHRSLYLVVNVLHRDILKKKHHNNGSEVVSRACWLTWKIQKSCMGLSSKHMMMQYVGETEAGEKFRIYSRFLHKRINCWMLAVVITLYSHWRVFPCRKYKIFCCEIAQSRFVGGNKCLYRWNYLYLLLPGGSKQWSWAVK